MTLHIDNPRLREKLERAAQQLGRPAEAILEDALDAFIASDEDAQEVSLEVQEARLARCKAILAHADALPRIPEDQRDPDLEWDKDGLPI